jgi:tetratricopeptide (TPR) repeat protein
MATASDPGTLTRRAVDILQSLRGTPDRAALDEAIGLLRRVVAVAPDAGGWANLSGALHTRFVAFGDPADLDECVAAGQSAADIAEPADPPYVIVCTNLAASLRLRFDRHGDPADLDRSITCGRRAVDASAPDDPRRAVRASNLANGLRTRGETTGDEDDIREAAAHAEEADRCCPAGAPARPAIASNVSMCRHALHRLTGDLATLTAAVAAGRESLAGAPPRTLAIRLSNTGLMLQELGRRTGRVELCDEAVVMTARGVGLTEEHGVEHDVNRVMVRQSASTALLSRFELTGDPADLHAGVRLAREAVAGNPAGAAAARAWNHLCNALQTGVETLGDDDGATDAAVRAGETALAVAGDRFPERATLLSTLGAAYRLRFEEHGRPADLDRALDLARRGVARRDGTAQLSTLGVVLQSRFEETGSVDDIREAAAVLRRAATTAVDRNNLAATLLRLFVATQDGALLDESIAVADRAVAESPPGHRSRAARVNTLAMAYRARAELLGSRADAGEAVRRARQACEAARDRAGLLRAARAGLAVALQTRYALTAARADLDEAIAVGWELLGELPAGHPDRPRYLGNQGAALHERFTARGSIADLDAAVSCLADAVTATPPASPDRPGRLGNLSSALRERHAVDGVRADAERAVSVAREAVTLTAADSPELAHHRESLGLALSHLDRLDEARDELAAALAGTPPGDESRPQRLSNLGGIHVRLFETTGRTAELDSAVAAAREAAEAMPDGDPRRLTYRFNLAVALQRRSGGPADRSEATAAFREVAGGSTGPMSVRAAAGRGWVMLAADQRDWPQATAAARQALELAAATAGRGVGRADQERMLAPNQGLASLAAACALHTGDPETAVELLEAGRGVLFAQSLELRTDLSSLAARQPGLAARFVELRGRLEAPARPDIVADMPGAVEPAETREAEVRRALAAEFDALIAEIRAVDGFDGFLRLPAFRDLAAATAGGPVVMLNVHSLRSDALIMHGGGVTVVPLPAATPAAVAEQARALLTAADAVDQAGVADVLAWLWEAVSGPVLAALRELPDGGGRRVWWCPVGHLAYLPLHAAGRAGGPGMLDHVVSSYTPTLRALLRARARPAAAVAGARLAVVAMPDTPGASRLLHVEAEAAAIAGRFAGPVTVLTGPQATHERVVAALGTASWAHFACHAVGRLDDPSRSELLVHDHAESPLTVLDIVRLDLPGAQLAYLSACETSMAGATLPDEAIHLASAFQLAGYRHVIATLWPVSDRAARRTSEATYAALTGPDDAADALHRAVLAARAARPGWYTWWAAMLHYGA